MSDSESLYMYIIRKEHNILQSELLNSFLMLQSVQKSLIFDVYKVSDELYLHYLFRWFG